MLALLVSFMLSCFRTLDYSGFIFVLFFTLIYKNKCQMFIVKVQIIKIKNGKKKHSITDWLYCIRIQPLQYESSLV